MGHIHAVATQRGVRLSRKGRVTRSRSAELSMLGHVSEDRPRCQFDENRAGSYRPRDGFAKMAVLVEPSDPGAQTLIRTPFGDQRFIGAFYVVAEGDGSYGATRDEFEQTHKEVAANQWTKTAPVLAYRIDVSCVVDTVVGGRLEVTVTAQPGDWLIRQSTGEVMVVRGHDFEERYVRERSERAPT